ncbi:hypothetical protein [Crystallibacter crystallopoietes]|uniref:hypothetical protein n=1 Tax=Crystallibacter crystallopoietes TaxID=37928 RepID=UPI0002ED3F77
MARSVAEHRSAVTALLRAALAELSQRPETVPLLQAVGRTLAENAAAPVSLPPFDNSQMDGYAIASAATAASTEFAVAAPIAAGHAAPPLDPGTAAPIMTGAMLPDGADAVVPIEQAVPDGFQPPRPGLKVTLPAHVPGGQFVRPAGSDIAAGALRCGGARGSTPRSSACWLRSAWTAWPCCRARACCC